MNTYQQILQEGWQVGHFQVYTTCNVTSLEHRERSESSDLKGRQQFLLVKEKEQNNNKLLQNRRAQKDCEKETAFYHHKIPRGCHIEGCNTVSFSGLKKVECFNIPNYLSSSIHELK